MGKKDKYRLENELYMKRMADEEGVKSLPGGILYKVVEEGSVGAISPHSGNIVTVYYRGTLINGREFDNTFNQGYPEAFRLNEVIDGWQVVLQQMRVGDSWVVYIPCQLGYGNKACGNIPACSTLIFEIQLVGVM